MSSNIVRNIVNLITQTAANLFRSCKQNIRFTCKLFALTSPNSCQTRAENDVGRLGQTDGREGTKGHAETAMLNIRVINFPRKFPRKRSYPVPAHVRQ